MFGDPLVIRAPYRDSATANPTDTVLFWARHSAIGHLRELHRTGCRKSPRVFPQVCEYENVARCCAALTIGDLPE